MGKIDKEALKKSIKQKKAAMGKIVLKCDDCECKDSESSCKKNKS